MIAVITVVAVMFFVLMFVMSITMTSVIVIVIVIVAIVITNIRHIAIRPDCNADWYKTARVTIGYG